MATTTSFTPGFDFEEAKTLLCIEQKTYENTPDNPPSHTKGLPPVPPPPGNWQRNTDYTPTTTTLLDNYWEVWRNQDKPNQYTIAVRGTVDTASSILADLLLPVVKARYDFKIKGIPISFNLAREEQGSDVVAGVHAGFTLSLLLMLLTTDRPLWLTLLDLATDTNNEIYITGHSQGASIAQLLTSFVWHSGMFNKASFKTYVFAPAKPGNDHYTYDLDQTVAVKGLSYAVVSSQDWVPQVPLTLEGIFSVNTPNPLRNYSDTSLLSGDASVKDVVNVAGGIEKAGIAAWSGRLKEKIGGLRDALRKEEIALPLASLSGTATDAQLDSGDLGGILDEILQSILPTLNYAKSGALTPVFAVAGSNPQDSGDYFWQHHLGNYLKYMQAQYGS